MLKNAAVPILCSLYLASACPAVAAPAQDARHPPGAEPLSVAHPAGRVDPEVLKAVLKRTGVAPSARGMASGSHTISASPAGKTAPPAARAPQLAQQPSQRAAALVQAAQRNNATPAGPRPAALGSAYARPGVLGGQSATWVTSHAARINGTAMRRY